MVDYLEDFPPFGTNKGSLEDDILELIEFTLPHEWQKHLIVQGLYPATKSINYLVELRKHL